ncbi:RidA family protein [Novosphingobium terrae]|uniref:RidA family protein n=1 Tax=Novosphingobium terrae TaxID=2726189 RepID=UPI001F142827|nr:RidA family protein [Novosphingobium terrae]
MMPSALIRTSLLLACLGLPFAAQAEPQFFSDPQSRAPFSPAVRVGDIIFLSGQTGHDAQGHLPEGMEAQARNAMDNVAATARRAGVTNDDIAKCTVMLSDMSQFAAFNAIYVRSFKPGHLPARSAFGANGLANGALVEVECIAAAPDRR